MNSYLPEGSHPLPAPYTQEALRKAMHNGEILEGIAVKCDERHNLTVDLGCCLGIIPREEAAIGIREGNLREIAILSRVGLPVCFHVQAMPPEEPPVLSRRSAQLEARMHLLNTLNPGDIVPATISNLSHFGAFCDIGCGIPALLGLENISVSRIAHSRDRFSPQQKVFTIIKSIDREKQRFFLSHKELLGTWAQNAEQFRPGQTVTGTIRSVQPYGAFIELLPNLSGLSDPVSELKAGDAVSVYIKSILPDRQKIKLVVLHRLDAAPQIPLHYRKTEGHMDFWEYAPGHFTVF